MSNNNEKARLLYDLAEKLDCRYLSDLHMVSTINDIKNHLTTIEPTYYTLDEWIYALNYITKSSERFISVADAKNFIKQWSPNT